MRKFMILGSLVALVVAALALPALAQQDDRRFGEARQDYYENLWDSFEERYEDDFEDEGFFAFADYRFFDEEGFFFGDDRDDNDRDWWNDDDEVVPAVSQSFDQEAQSGDVSQSFNVSNTGDNSNQCANVQGVANTGNAQNQIGVVQYGSEADDFSFEDSGSTITVSPNSATRCDQAVNQAATAYGR